VLGAAHVAVGARKLVHSFAALLPPPRSRRHNPDLLFATYFSGFAVHEGGAFLGYGVNDEGWGFAEVGVDALW
jgi:hypothetical protein